VNRVDEEKNNAYENRQWGRVSLTASAGVDDIFGTPQDEGSGEGH
jgi:hypothetical protein